MIKFVCGGQPSLGIFLIPLDSSIGSVLQFSDETLIRALAVKVQARLEALGILEDVKRGPALIFTSEALHLAVMIKVWESLRLFELRTEIWLSADRKLEIPLWENSTSHPGHH